MSSAILDSLPQAVFAFDNTTLRVSYCNAAFPLIPGVPAQPVGQLLAEVFPPAEYAAILSAVSSLLTARVQTPVEIKAGGMTLSLLFNAIADATGNVAQIIGTAANVTPCCACDGCLGVCQKEKTHGPKHGKNGHRRPRQRLRRHMPQFPHARLRTQEKIHFDAQLARCDVVAPPSRTRVAGGYEPRRRSSGALPDKHREGVPRIRGELRPPRNQIPEYGQGEHSPRGHARHSARRRLRGSSRRRETAA
ncbi:MAG: PAS domain-containing protein [Kiritimatiellae bacterium]|nr:PAS domain-containing protein [Kiritimatiellia bacterium]